MYVAFLICTAASFVLTVILCLRIIPILRKKKFGQKILDIGPRWHKKKEGTPTMGGICFLIPILAVSGIGFLFFPIAISEKDLARGILVLFYGASNAIVGILDDLSKFKKRQNQGLTPRQKLVLQTTFAVAFLSLLFLYAPPSTRVKLPFTDITAELGVWYYLAALLLLVGVVNFANLTDGIDGLASSVAAIVASFFALCAHALLSFGCIIVCGALLGGVLAFLIFNYHPARVFMGDTGSLFLGAILSGCSFILDDPFLILLGGGIYLLEGLSVILQVGWFRLTRGKRLFRMAPLHHHFEKGGWGEVKVVSVFSFFTLLFCLLAYLGCMI